MEELSRQIENNVRGWQLLRPRQRILVAVSGGVDSMVLLTLLSRLSSKYKWQIFAAHLNHMLRGRSSDADARAVRRTCGKLGVEVVIGKANVAKFARSSRLSIEMAARKLRHDFLAKTARLHGVSTIVLAHHADDQVELFFLRLLRGAGIDGLAGMRWNSLSPSDTHIELVRPMLNIPKSALLSIAVRDRIHFREDASNASTDILRNRIRRNLLPLLESEYQPALNRTVLRMMDIFAAESGTLTALADNWVRGQGWKHPGLTISTGPQALKASRVFPGRLIAQSTFDSLPLSLQRRCIQQQLIALGVPTDFTLVERLRESPGKALSAAKGLSASSAEGEESASRRKLEALPILVKRDETGEVSLVASRRGPSMFPAESAVFRLHGRAGEINFAGAKFNWRIRSASGASRVRAIQGREVFDAERIGELVRLRHWQPGDRFQPIGMHHSVKLQDLFTNAKIPQDRRHRLVVAEGQDDGIFWVEGLRIGDKYKLSSHARRVLIWRYST